MKIKIYGGEILEIDDDDFEKINKIVKPGCQWYYDKRNKVVKAWCMVNGASIKLAMHRVIMDCIDDSRDVDHVLHNPFDLRKESLRIVSHQDNCFNNQRPAMLGIFKGVSPRRNGWCARIRTKEGRKFLGDFTSAIDAAIAYNVAAHKYHGEFACFNALPFTT